MVKEGHSWPFQQYCSDSVFHHYLCSITKLLEIAAVGAVTTMLLAFAADVASSSDFANVGIGHRD